MNENLNSNFKNSVLSIYACLQGLYFMHFKEPNHTTVLIPSIAGTEGTPSFCYTILLGSRFSLCTSLMRLGEDERNI
jgi:hypothetical protein